MPQGIPANNQEIVEYGTELVDGKKRTLANIAAHFGLSVATVRKALVGHERSQRPATASKEKDEANTVLDSIRDSLNANVWPPSQRDIASQTGLTLSRVNYLLQVLRKEGLIEIGSASREIRIVGAQMVIPKVTM